MQADSQVLRASQPLTQRDKSSDLPRGVKPGLS